MVWRPKCPMNYWTTKAIAAPTAMRLNDIHGVTT
jgi:hypothetical protein